MSCLCGGYGILTKPWYYDNVIAKPYVDPKTGKTFYACFHGPDATIKMPSREDWLKAATQGAKGKMMVTCTMCEISNDSILNDLQGGRGMSCLCGGSNILTKPWYYDNVIAKPYVDPKTGKTFYACFHGPGATIKMPSREEWVTAAAYGNAGKIVVTCKTCDTSNDSILNHLQDGRGMRCRCSGRKTEQLLAEWLEQSGHVWETQFSACTNPKTGYPLWFDFTCHELNMSIELDGRQHFEPIDFGSRQSQAATDADFQDLVKRDLCKEQCAVDDGRLVARLLQQDVWNDQYGWDAFLDRVIQERADGKSKGGGVVCQPGAPEYTSGPYWDARHARCPLLLL
jgi:hypothetical protein